MGKKGPKEDQDEPDVYQTRLIANLELTAEHL